MTTESELRSPKKKGLRIEVHKTVHALLVLDFFKTTSN